MTTASPSPSPHVFSADAVDLLKRLSFLSPSCSGKSVDALPTDAFSLFDLVVRLNSVYAVSHLANSSFHESHAMCAEQLPFFISEQRSIARHVREVLDRKLGQLVLRPALLSCLLFYVDAEAYDASSLKRDVDVLLAPGGGHARYCLDDDDDDDDDDQGERRDGLESIQACLFDGTATGVEERRMRELKGASGQPAPQSEVAVLLVCLTAALDDAFQLACVPPRPAAAAIAPAAALHLPPPPLDSQSAQPPHLPWLLSRPAIRMSPDESRESQAVSHRLRHLQRQLLNTRFPTLSQPCRELRRTGVVPPLSPAQCTSGRMYHRETLRCPAAAPTHLSPRTLPGAANTLRRRRQDGGRQQAAARAEESEGVVVGSGAVTYDSEEEGFASAPLPHLLRVHQAAASHGAPRPAPVPRRPAASSQPANPFLVDPLRRRVAPVQQHSARRAEDLAWRVPAPEPVVPIAAMRSRKRERPSPHWSDGPWTQRQPHRHEGYLCTATNTRTARHLVNGIPLEVQRHCLEFLSPRYTRTASRVCVAWHRLIRGEPGRVSAGAATLLRNYWANVLVTRAYKRFFQQHWGERAVTVTALTLHHAFTASLARHKAAMDVVRHHWKSVRDDRTLCQCVWQRWLQSPLRARCNADGRASAFRLDGPPAASHEVAPASLSLELYVFYLLCVLPRCPPAASPLPPPLRCAQAALESILEVSAAVERPADVWAALASSLSPSTPRFAWTTLTRYWESILLTRHWRSIRLPFVGASSGDSLADQRLFFVLQLLRSGHTAEEIYRYSQRLLQGEM